MIYLDASVLVSALTREPQSAAVRAGLQSASQLQVSGWTELETASTISTKRRRGDLTVPQHQLALQLLEAATALNWTSINIVEGDYSAARNWVSDPALGLRGGDALHLAIAQRHGLAIATLDIGMAKAARHLAIPCAPLSPA